MSRTCRVFTAAEVVAPVASADRVAISISKVTVGAAVKMWSSPGHEKFSGPSSFNKCSLGFASHFRGVPEWICQIHSAVNISLDAWCRAPFWTAAWALRSWPETQRGHDPMSTCPVTGELLLYSEHRAVAWIFASMPGQSEQWACLF